GVFDVAVEVRRCGADRIAHPFDSLAHGVGAAPDRGAFARSGARRRTTRGFPLREGLVAQCSVWCVRPIAVVQLVEYRVLGPGADDALLVGRMQPGFVAGDESSTKRHALRAELDRAGEPGSVTDAARCKHGKGLKRSHRIGK